MNERSCTGAGKEESYQIRHASANNLGSALRLMPVPSMATGA